MPWVNLTAPSVGDPTEQPFAADIVGNLQFLYNQFLNVVGNREQILNGSFESDADNDGSPDGWVIAALGAGGTFTWDESTVAGDGKAWHGKRSAKCTSPGGGGNGGKSLTSEDFFEVSEGRPYKIQFATKSSVADVHNTVAIVWYDSTQTIISTNTFHDDAATNPTSWTVFEYVVEPAVNARYAKLVFSGCVNDDVTAGSTWFDDIRILGYVPAFERRCQFSTPGSFKFKVPTGVTWCAVIAVGAGGGGGGSNTANGGGGGGGGGMAWDIQRLTAGTSYVFTVGAGGAGGVSNNDGANGGSSTFVGTATLTANGGTKGLKVSSGGTGGAGGTATGGRVNTTGTTGGTRSGAVGGDGGEQPAFGGYGPGGSGTDVDGSDGPGYGGGGGGSGGASVATNGGDGSNGFILILF